MAMLNTDALNLLSLTFAQNSSALNIYSIQQSSTFVNMLNMFANNGGQINIVPNSVASETIDTRHIDIGADLLPGSGTNDSLNPLVFVTLLGHELGHATQPGGLPIWSNTANVYTAIQSGDNAEGVALYQEYQVATEIGSAMYSSLAAAPGATNIQTLISQAVLGTTPGSAQAVVNALGVGAIWTDTEYPSPTLGATAPTANNPAGYATYHQFYAMQYIAGMAGITIQNWANAITNNPDGSWSFKILVPTAAGNYILQGRSLLNPSGQELITSSFVNAMNGATGQNISTASASGAPQDAVNLTSAGNGITNVAVTDSAGVTTSYNVSGVPNVVVATGMTNYSSNSGANVLVGGDGSTLVGGATQNLLVSEGAGVTIFGGTGANQVVLVGALNTAVVSGGNVTTGSNTNSTLFGNNNGIAAGVGSTVASYGASNDLTAGPSCAVLVGNTGSGVSTINAYGDTANATLSTGLGNGVYVLPGAMANLNGSTDTVYIYSGSYLGILGGTNITVETSGACTIGTQSGATFNIQGGNASINLVPDTYAGLLGGGGWNLTANNATVATWAGTNFSVQGNNDTLEIGDHSSLKLSGQNANLYGNNLTVTTAAGSSLNLTGGSDVFNAAPGSYIGVLGGSGVMINGTGLTVATAGPTNVNIAGGNENIYLGAGGAVGLLGGGSYSVSAGSATVTLGTYTSANVSGSNNNIVMVANDYLGITSGLNDVVYATDEVIALVPGVAVTIVGTSNVIAGSADYISIIGNNNSIAGTGNNYALDGTGNQVPAGNTAGYGAVLGGGGNGSGSSGSSPGAGGIVDTTNPLVALDTLDPPETEIISSVDNMSPGFMGLVQGQAGASPAVVNVVAQYDRANGYTAAAASADAALTQATQALAGDFATSASSLVKQPAEPTLSSSVITWSFASSATGGASPISSATEALEQPVIEAAIQSWQQASGLTFEQVSANQLADFTIGSGDFDTQASGIVGYTSGNSQNGRLLPGTIVRLEDPSQTPLVVGFNGQLMLGTTNVSLYQDALHEIGHALGLSDDSDPSSVMYASLGPSNATLDSTDIAAIQALYGPEGSAGAYFPHASVLTNPVGPPSLTMPSPPVLPLPMSQPSPTH